MTVEEEEVDKVPGNGWWFQSLLLSSVRDEIPSESSRLLDMRQRWVDF